MKLVDNILAWSKDKRKINEQYLADLNNKENKKTHFITKVLVKIRYFKYYKKINSSTKSAEEGEDSMDPFESLSKINKKIYLDFENYEKKNYILP